MKPQKHTFFLMLSITLFLGLSCKKTNVIDDNVDFLLNETEKSLNKIQTVAFKTTRIDKPFTSKDTLYSSAICSLYIEPKEKIGMYFTTNIKYEADTLYHQVYNGKNFSIASLYNENATVKLKNFENINLEKENKIESYNLGFLSRTIFDPNQSFTSFKKRSERENIEKMEVHEEIFQQEPVFVLTIRFKNHDESEDYIQNGVDRYYIRKNDFLPIAYSTYGEFQSMNEYEFVTIDYLTINNLELKSFEPYTKAEEINIEAIYKNNKSLFEDNNFANKKKNANKKKDVQRTIEAEIKNNKLPFNEFVLNNEKTIKLSDLRGKVILLDFWYRGCLPCLKTIPYLIKLQEEFKNDLVIIGINDVDDKEDVTNFLNYKKANYLSTYKSEINISKSLKFNAFPTLLALNKKGEIVKTQIGFDDKSTLSKTIKKLIKESKQ